MPLRVYSRCEADKETERREYGAPMTSNRASKGSLVFAGVIGLFNIPAGSSDGSIELLIASPPMRGDSAVGVVLI